MRSIDAIIDTLLEKKQKLNELFVQAAEIEALPKGEERDMQILRLSISAELDASNLYEKFIALAQSEKIAEVLTSISEEEKVHVGELKALLEQTDPEFTDAEEKGKGEVADISGRRRRQ